MGTYLSKPITEKISSDANANFFSYGASSMQGWRIYQEDAHNTILDFDENINLFAVYDGHGGHEVAVYTAANFPDFIKENEKYKKGNYSEALKEAFLQFDATLIEPDVLPVLKEIAGTKDEEDSDYDGEEVNHLCREATMPLEEVMAKYSEPLAEFYCHNLKTVENCRDESSVNSSVTQEVEPCSSKLPEFSSCSNKNETDSTISTPPKIELKNKESSEQNISDSETRLNNENGIINEHNLDESQQGKISSKSNNVEDANLSKHSQLNGEIIKEDDNSNLNKVLSSIEKKQESECCTQPLEDENLKTKSDCICSVESKEKNPFKRKKNVNSPKLEAIKTDKRVLQKRKALQIIMEQSLKKVNAEEDSDEDDDSYGDISEQEPGLNGDDSNSDSEEDLEESSEEDSEADYEEEEEDEEEGKNYSEFAMNMREEPGFDSGCTACVVLVVKSELIVANVGDSRCVVCRKGKAVDMSIDHKPEDDEESSRIKKAGGKITSDGRVNGGLNLSRALGDHSYKQNKSQKPEDQMISPLPDIRTLIVTPEDEFMIVACDGIWNSMSSQEACDFVSERLQNNTKLSSICEEIFDHCLAPDVHGDGTGCDNMTCIIVRFDRPANLEIVSEQVTEENEKKRNLSDSDITENSQGSFEKKAKLELTTNGTDILEK